MKSEEYSYILLIPVMVVSLFIVERKKVFDRLDYSLRAGSLVILAGICVGGSGTLLPSQAGANVRLSIEILGLAMVWIGAFVLCYGAPAARAGMFALLCSLLVVPLPRAIMLAPLDLVRRGSADVTGLLFTITGVPFLRSGMMFVLARISFMVTPECSGIHSTVALLIAALLAGRFCLKAAWQKALLVPFVIPIVSFTNGLRMFIMATLSNYVSVSFFQGNLHRKGGSLFFALALVILAVVVELLGGRLSFGDHRDTQAATSSPDSGPTGFSANS